MFILKNILICQILGREREGEREEFTLFSIIDGMKYKSMLKLVKPDVTG